MARLEQARLLDAFDRLRTRPARFALACYLAELVDRLAPEGARRSRRARALRGRRSARSRAVAARDPDARLRALLELRVLAALGLRPELRRCVRCGRDVEAARDAPRGRRSTSRRAVRCVAPARRGADGVVAVHLGTLRALEQGLRLPLDRLDRLALGAQATAEARALLSRFLRFHVGFELRSERFLDAVLRRATRASA